MRLHLGCGNVILPGFVNVDAVGGPGVDVVDDVRTLSAFPERCADLIYASHVLDHVSRREIATTLGAWRNRLRAGGTLRLAVSDFAAVVAAYRDGLPLDRLLGHIVGGQKSPYDQHGIVFDEATLTQALHGASFENVRRWDWRKVDHGTVDDFSQAYEPHMDKSTGLHMSLNLEADCTEIYDPGVRAWVIGDSHAVLFGGGRAHPKHFDLGQPFYSARDDGFGVLYVGPWLAWRLNDDDRWAHLVEHAERLQAIDPAPVVCTLGEIDCRTRLPQAGREYVNSVVDRYATALARLRDRIYVPVVAWDPPPPTAGPVYNAEFPAMGTYQERREISDSFSAALDRACAEKQLGFASIRQHLIDGPERTAAQFYADSIHLNPDKLHTLPAQAIEQALESIGVL